MLSFTCSHSLIRRPFLHSSAPGARLPTRPGALHPISRSFRIFESQSRPSNTRWTRISCFRQEEFSSDTPKSEYIEHLVPEEVVKSEFDDSKVVKRDWGVTLREEISCNHYYHFDLEDISKAASRFSFFLFWGFISQTADAVSRAIGSRWSVPWSAETILQVMLLWVAAFCFIGSWMVPFAAHVAGFSRESLTNRGQALFSLVTDVTEGLVGITIICRCLSRFRPLPPDWFKFSLKGTWQLDVALGCLMFPLVNRLSQFNLSLLPLLPSTPVTISSVEQAIMARDPVAMAMYAVVVSVCAPMWEEILFRGFLLPSLTKYMPVWSAVLVSSVVFALAHWNVQRILPLIFLGVVMGVVFARSRNLLPSMLLHSLWNGFVFLDLMK